MNTVTQFARRLGWGRSREVLDALARIERKVDAMAAKIDDVISDLTAEKTIIGGLTVFIQNLKDQLTAQGLDQSKVDAAFALAESNKADLAAALTANVPPTPPPTS